METKSYTSFIPKNSMPLEGVRTHSSVNLFFVITFIIFLLTLGAAGGLFVYKKNLNDRIDATNKDLLAAQASLDKGNINTWSRLDDRITISKQLMQGHIATSLLFKLFEDQTMRRIQFSSLDFSTGSQGTIVTIKGVTDSYATLALQADVLGTESVSKFLKNAIISGVALDDKGHVTFTLTANVDAGLISYAGLINSLNSQGSSASVNDTSATTANQ